MSLQEFREKANLWLYGNKERVLLAFKFLNVFVTIGAIFTLVYYYGYPHTGDEEGIIFGILKGSFAFYVLHYVVRFVYDFHPLQFLKSSWFEGAIMFLLIAEAIAFNITGSLLLEKLFRSIGILGYRDFSLVFIQLYFLFVVLIELQRSTSLLPKIKVHPSFIFIASFVVIILGGSLLLVMPEMTTKEGSMPFLDAMFISTSATTTTGLSTLDISADFTFKGQVVILILMKLGGLNLIAFGSFVMLASRFGLQVRQHEVLEDFVHKSSFLSGQGLLGKTILWSVGIELIGALCLFLTFSRDIPFASMGDKIFHSVFHSVSAFNNAGLSSFEGGFFGEYIRYNFFAHWVMIFVMFFGALGMINIFDLFDIQSMRERLRFPWKRIAFSTKIALYFAFILIAAGSVVFFITEYHKTLSGYSFFGKVTTVVFQSVSSRSSGFNSIDTASLAIPSLLFLMLLMFIGGASGSTGGGIKTSTFAIIYAHVVSSLKGTKNAELFRRTISGTLISRAYSVLLFFLILIFASVFALSISEHALLENQQFTMLDLVFEEVAAITTAGYSTGPTASLSDAGKVVIIISMFIGRIGTLTIAFLLFGKVMSRNYSYPQGHTMVG